MGIDLMWETDRRVKGLEDLLGRVAEACFSVEGVEGAGFCVTIVEDDQIKELNREKRSKDEVTDVLSFPTVRYAPGTTARDAADRIRAEYDPALGFCNLGDCVLNISRAEEQAAAFGHSLSRELGYLTAHSAFHLMGYDHMEPMGKRIMRAQEEKAMAIVGLERSDGEGDTHGSKGI